MVYRKKKVRNIIPRGLANTTTKKTIVIEHATIEGNFNGSKRDQYGQEETGFLALKRIPEDQFNKEFDNFRKEYSDAEVEINAHRIATRKVETLGDGIHQKRTKKTIVQQLWDGKKWIEFVPGKTHPTTCSVTEAETKVWYKNPKVIAVVVIVLGVLSYILWG